MPIATFKEYKNMLDAALKGKYAYPAINVFNMTTIQAALSGLAESRSDGIIQVSLGGAKFAAGAMLSQRPEALFHGALALAEYTHRCAEHYDVLVALHTDHCLVDSLDTFIKPLLAETKRRRARGEKNLFGSHMFDGSTLSLQKNLEVALPLLEECASLDIILEIEVGVVGGEEDGVKAEKDAKLYTTSEDMLYVAQRLGLGEKGEYMLAACFGNVHGVYKSGLVKLRPSILREGQAALAKQHGAENIFKLVFHGGSGSRLDEIHETLDYGVVKMNIDTDMQYAFTRSVADHFFKNYSGVLKIDGEVGVKKQYDPRGYLKKAELAMKERVKQACTELCSQGKTLLG